MPLTVLSENLITKDEVLPDVGEALPPPEADQEYDETIPVKPLVTI